MSLISSTRKDRDGQKEKEKGERHGMSDYGTRQRVGKKKRKMKKRGGEKKHDGREDVVKGMCQILARHDHIQKYGLTG